MGRSTISGWLVASGLQFRDWTGAYRLFQSNRMDVAQLFGVARNEVVQAIKAEEPNIYAHMDDTLIRKTGRKIHGAKWLRDPLGPPFQSNLVWGQRFIQLSLSACTHMDKGPCRAIPVDLRHCPVVLKPRKDSDSQAWEAYKNEHQQSKLSVMGAKGIQSLRAQLDADGWAHKKLVVSVDGSYTNNTVLKSKPKGVIIIGRVRKDLKIFSLPEPILGRKGRNRTYGAPLPTPEEIRQSEAYPWRKVEAWAAGKVHEFQLKCIPNIQWRKAGAQDLQLIVIRPVGYRLTKKSPVLYRDPAYLICTDASMDLQTLLQAYLWRWEIEVNFRDQKTLLGCGQAQVRKEEPCFKVPAFVTAVYGLFLVAANKATQIELPRSKWYPRKGNQRITTGDLLNILRTMSWAESIKINFSDFVRQEHKQRSARNASTPWLAAFAYTRQ